MKQVLTVLAVLAVLAGCNLTGGANASRVVSGQVMVPSGGYWTYIKLGAFSGGSAGTYTGLDTWDNGLGVGDYRVYYSSANTGVAAPINPVAGTSYAIIGSGTTLRDYTFELPSTLPVTNEYYYYAAWYDNDLDDILDLVDSNASGTIPNGEYNRCATKATTNGSGNPTVVTIDDFRTSMSGSYKYVGHDNAAYSEQIDLDTSTDSGFDFPIANNSGW